MTENQPEYIVEGITFDDEHHLEMAVLTNGRRFHIDFRPTDLRPLGQSSPSKYELEFLALVKEVDDMFIEKEDPDRSSEETCLSIGGDSQAELESFDTQACNGTCCYEDPLESWILQPFLQQHVFQDMAPLASTPLLSTLHDRIHIPTLSFTLKLVNGELITVTIPHQSGKLRMNPNLVTFQGKGCWFKPVDPQIPDTVYTREVDSLMRIEKAGLLDRIRVPRLRALVMSETGGGEIQGFLLDVVSDQGTVSERRDDPVALRKRWYNDVARMLDLLHVAGIVWGDYKPENMLVDEDDNVWLIDFGGGFSHGWVDQKNSQTKEGDLQGLMRFKEFLDLK